KQTVDFPNIGKEYFLNEIKWRKKLTSAIESYLMANRGEEDFASFLESVVILAETTLAYDLANEVLKDKIVAFFKALAKYIEEKEPLKETQYIFSKTLLGIDSSKEIFNWVEFNREYLLNIYDSNEWLIAIWDLLIKQIDDSSLNSIFPNDFLINLAKKWINGESYEKLNSF
ncbi:TPA: hypothetical protein ACGEAE_004074, partial [Acinetobacter baumannii]